MAALWCALAIPLIAAAVLWLGFSRWVRLWELLVPFGVCLGLISAARLTAEYAQCSDTEYWTGWATKAEYHEPWNELVTHTETYTETVGSGKNAKVVTKRRTVRTVVDHPARWTVHDSNGAEHAVDSSAFEALAKRWGLREFHNMSRAYHTVNGNMYRTTFPGDDARLEVVSTAHSYQNRVIASQSGFKTREPTAEERREFALYDYPALKGYTLPSILGGQDDAAERRLGVLNARLGREKQVRVWILVFHGQPLQAASLQEDLWQGGNKNELVLCVGEDAGAVKWGYVFSWTEQDLLKVECRNYITDHEKLDLNRLVGDIEPLIRKSWERKQFKDFDYLEVEPTLGMVLLTHLLTLAASVGSAVWVVKNSV